MSDNVIEQLDESSSLIDVIKSYNRLLNRLYQITANLTEEQNYVRFSFKEIENKLDKIEGDFL